MLGVLGCLRQLPSFRALQLSLRSYYADAELVQVVKAAAAVPLVGLYLTLGSGSMPVEAASSLGHLTRLTVLSLTSEGWGGPAVMQLAAALHQHRVLQRLHISNTSRRQSTPYGAREATFEWLHVCQAVRFVTGLRCASFGSCLLGDAAAQLGAATQLTRLSLVSLRCGVTNTGRAVLGSALRHLLPHNLHIDETPPLEPACVIT